MYKNFSLELAFLMTDLAIDSKVKHWSIVAPRYFTHLFDSSVWPLLVTFKNGCPFNFCLEPCHVFKMHNNLAPKYMSEHFSPASNAHSYITRFRVSVNQSGEPCSDTKRYSLPGVKGFGQKTFAYQGCYLWNSLPQFVRNSKNVSAFKSNAKKDLLERP